MRKIVKENIINFQQSLRLKGVERSNPIIVFQMGKVGSSTVVKTLREHYKKDTPVIQVHTLNPNQLEKAIQMQRDSISPYLHKHLIVSSILIKKLDDEVFPCRFITLTREPVERAISFVFEDIKKKAPDSLKKNDEIDLSEIVRSLDSIFTESSGIVDPTAWFERELKERFELDVFSVPFDVEKGYKIIKKNLCSLLILRMEDLNWALIPALSEFLQIEQGEIRIRRDNIGKKKWYAEAIAEIKANYKLEEHLAKKVYDTKYYRHFYGSEYSNHYSRWT